MQIFWWFWNNDKLDDISTNRKKRKYCSKINQNHMGSIQYINFSINNFQ